MLFFNNPSFGLKEGGRDGGEKLHFDDDSYVAPQNFSFDIENSLLDGEQPNQPTAGDVIANVEKAVATSRRKDDVSFVAESPSTYSAQAKILFPKGASRSGGETFEARVRFLEAELRRLQSENEHLAKQLTAKEKNADGKQEIKKEMDQYRARCKQALQLEQKKHQQRIEQKMRLLSAIEASYSQEPKKAKSSDCDEASQRTRKAAESDAQTLLRGETFARQLQELKRRYVQSDSKLDTECVPPLQPMFRAKASTVGTDALSNWCFKPSRATVDLSKYVQVPSPLPCLWLGNQRCQARKGRAVLQRRNQHICLPRWKD